MFYQTKKEIVRSYRYLNTKCPIMLLFFGIICLSISCVLGNKGIEQGAVAKGAVDIDIGTSLRTLQSDIGEIKKQTNAIASFQKEINNSGTIRYGGAGWAVAGAGLMVFLFLGTSLVVVYMLFRNRTNLLSLVTSAVHECDIATQKTIKDKINHVTSNGGPYGESHKLALAKFVKTNGVDAK